MIIMVIQFYCISLSVECAIQLNIGENPPRSLTLHPLASILGGLFSTSTYIVQVPCQPLVAKLVLKGKNLFFLFISD